MFPHSPFLRRLFVFCLVLFIAIFAKNAYQFYQIKAQEARLMEEQQQLEQEKAQLDEKKKDLQDPSHIEDRARNQLGLVKPGEVPYIK